MGAEYGKGRENDEMRYTRPDAPVKSSDTIDDPIRAQSEIASYAGMVSHVPLIETQEERGFHQNRPFVRRAMLSDLSLPPQGLWT